MVMEEKITKEWYVIRTISGKEKKIKEQIENEIHKLNLQDYILEVLVPSEKITQMRKGKKINKERIFYPGYVFIHATLDAEIQTIIKNIKGVFGFLTTSDGKPAPLKSGEIDHILHKVNKTSHQNDENITPFYIDDVVKIIDGPFNGFTGVVESIDNNKKTVKVIVKIFGRKTPLELTFMQIEKEK